MRILIDGYNLLHVSGILGRGRGPGGLERARQALLNFLASSLEEDDIRRTVVVFDANDPTVGGPKRMEHRGIKVRFAADHTDADELIIQLIDKESAPRRLTVVSSDHRIRRAARRRRAISAESRAWFEDLLRRRADDAKRDDLQEPPKPGTPISAEQVQYWLREFANAEAEVLAEESAASDDASTSTPDEEHSSKDREPEKQPSDDTSLLDPFPEDYKRQIDRELGDM